MTITKSFSIGDVLSITDGKLVSPRHIGGVYDILGWMTGESLMTHQLPRAMDECKPSLVAQFPELSEEVVPEGIDSKEAAEDYLASLYPKYGATVEVEPLAPEDHTAIDPIAEVKMNYPHIRVIAPTDG